MTTRLFDFFISCFVYKILSFFSLVTFFLFLSFSFSYFTYLAKIFGICERYNVKLCYCRSSSRGFPCSVDLSKKLKNLKPKNPLKSGDENKKTVNYSEIKKRKSDFGDLNYGKNEFTDVDDIEKFLSDEKRTEIQQKSKNENGNGNGTINKNEKRERRKDGGNKGLRGKIENLNKDKGRKQSGNASDNSFEFDVYDDYDKYDDEDDDDDERRRKESRNRHRENKEVEVGGRGGGENEREESNEEKGIRGIRGEAEVEGDEGEDEEEEELKGVHVADSLDQGLAW